MGTDPESQELSFQQLRELDAYFDEQLKSYSDGKSDSRKDDDRAGSSIRTWFIRAAAVVLFALLPFLLLIRISLLVYSRYQLNGWLALLAGVSATILLLLLYGIVITYKVRGKTGLHRYLVRGIIGLVLAYCAYGLLYLSSYNVKSEEIRSYYRSLHPILRVTVTTASLADGDLVVTDLQRTPDDYLAMGMAPRQESLHYEQPSGYVHAVDLRTIGKPEWKNRLIEYSLSLLGFRTIRHVGTADHLHVALPLND